MKKTAFIALLLLVSIYSFGQKSVSKDVTVKYEENSEEARTLIEKTTVPAPEKDCGEFHLGKIMFLNSTKKQANFDLVDVKGNTMCVLDIKAAGTAYVNDIEAGEYFLKKTSEKKAKKKNMINVVECMLKAVNIDEKALK